MTVPGLSLNTRDAHEKPIIQYKCLHHILLAGPESPIFYFSHFHRFRCRNQLDFISNAIMWNVLWASASVESEY